MRIGIPQRLWFAFGAIGLVAVGLILYEFQLFGRVIEAIRIITVDDIEVTESLREATRYEFEASLRTGRAFGIASGNFSNSQTPAAQELARLAQEHDRILRQASAAFEKGREIIARRRQQAVSAERLRLWSDLQDTFGGLLNDFQVIQEQTAEEFRLLEGGQLAEAWQRQAAVEQVRDDVARRLEHGAAVGQQLIDAGGMFILDRYSAARQSAMVALLLVLAAATAGIVALSRTITTPLRLVMDTVQRVAEGDLTQQIALARRDELGMLARHFDQMVQGLGGMARQTTAVAEEVNLATAQIRASIQQQAAGVTEQLAALEETTATLNQITVSGGEITHRAREVSDKAMEANEASGAGLKAVAVIRQAMEAIGEQSEAVADNNAMLAERTRTIGEIIITVNDLAERSHLLALNAAIEAAAAGEHGRTFAIVAREIKALADRAKQATAQVRGNLGDIQQGIDASVRLTEEAVQRVAAGKRQSEAAQQTIGSLADNIQESVQAFQQIVAATNQQQLGLEQVMQALQSIRQANAQTAASTRQLEGAAGRLHETGQRLMGSVRSFRL